MKHLAMLRERAADLIDVAYDSMSRLLYDNPPGTLVLSLADFEITLESLSVYVVSLLSNAKDHGVDVVIDSGGLEKYMIEEHGELEKYFSDPAIFEDPVVNLRRQLALRPEPDLVTLLDELDRSCTFEKLLDVKQELDDVLAEAHERGIKVILVLHQTDLSSLENLRNSGLLNAVDFIAVPNREIHRITDIEHFRNLGKDLIIFGCGNLTREYMLTFLKNNVRILDTLVWITSNLNMHEDDLKCEEIRFGNLETYDQDNFFTIFFNNLLLLRKYEAKIAELVERCEGT
jgi:hypothetical protein